MTPHATEIWLADAAEALHILKVTSDSISFDVFRALGMSLTQETEARSTAAPNQGIIESTPRSAPPASQFNAKKPLAEHDSPVIPIDSVYELRPAPTTATPNPWAHVRPLTRSKVSANPMPFTPLLQLPSARPILSAALATTRRSRNIDMRRALAVLARGEVLQDFPYVSVPTLRAGAQIVLDRGRALEPYRRDCDDVIDTVRAVIGRSAVSVQHFVDAPDHYQPPDPGTPVLALTDFGAPGQPFHIFDTWNRVAAELRERGSTLMILAPRVIRPRELDRSVLVLPWDRATNVRDALEVRAGRSARLLHRKRNHGTAQPHLRNDEQGLVSALARRDPALIRLAELLSPAVTIEPELLRQIRLQLMPELDASAESALWFSPLIRASGRDGFSFSVTAAADLLTRLRSRWDDESQRDDIVLARTIMADLHSDKSPPLRLEEVVAWYIANGEEDRVENALAPAVAGLISNADLNFWGRQAALRLPQKAIESTSGWLLSQMGGMETPGVSTDFLALPIAPIMRSLPTDRILVRHTGRTIELGALQASAAVAIRVPRTVPRLIEINSSGGSTRVKLGDGERLEIPIDSTTVELRDAADRSFQLSHQAADLSASCVWVGDSRTGFFVAPDLVITAATRASIQYVRYRGERLSVNTVVQTSEVAVLRLAHAKTEVPVLNVGPRNVPIHLDDTWRGARVTESDDAALSGTFENADETGRFSVLLDRPDEIDELRGCPVVVDGRLIGMILGYQSSYAVGLSTLSDALRQVPPRPHGLVVGEPRLISDDLTGATLWVAERAFDGEPYLVRRIRNFLPGPDRSQLAGDTDALTAEIPSTLEQRAAQLPDGDVLGLSADDVRSLEAATAGGSSAIGPGAALLASAGRDGTVRNWSVDHGAVLTGLMSLAGEITTVAFSPDGVLLAAAAATGVVRLWRIDSGEHRDLFTDGPVTPHGLVFSADGRSLAAATADGAVRVWAIDTGERVRDLRTARSGPKRAVMFSPDGRLILSIDGRGEFQSWDVETGREPAQASIYSKLWTRQMPIKSTDFAFSPDGNQIAGVATDGSITVVSTIGSRRPRTLRGGYRGGLTAVAFSPDGRRLASGSGEGQVRVHETDAGGDAGGFVTLPGGHSGQVTSIAFSPDGRLLASAGADGTVRTWRVNDGELVAVLAGHTGQITSVAFSPNPAAQDDRSGQTALSMVRSAEYTAAFADLQQAILLEFHQSLPGLGDSLDWEQVEAPMAGVLGEETYRLVRGYAEWTMRECIDAITSSTVYATRAPLPWQIAAADLGLPADAGYSRILIAGLRMTADAIGQRSRSIQNLEIPVGNDRAFERAGLTVNRVSELRVDVAGTDTAFRKVIDGLTERLGDAGTVAFDSVRAATDPESEVSEALAADAALAAALVRSTLWTMDEPQPSLEPIRTLSWRTCRDRLSGAGAPGFSARLDALAFLDEFQRLIAAGLDAVSRVTGAEYRTKYTLEPAAAQLVRSAPFDIATVETEHGIQLKMPYGNLAGIFSWAAPQLMSCLRLAISERLAREAGRPRQRIIAFSGPLNDSNPALADVAALRNRLEERLRAYSIGPGDQFVIADIGDLPAAEMAQQRGATVVMLLDRTPDSKFDSRLLTQNVEVVLANANVLVANAIWPPNSSRSMAHRRNQWMLNYAEATGIPPVVMSFSEPLQGPTIDRATELHRLARLRRIDTWT